MKTNSTLTLTFGYTNTNFTSKFKIENFATEDDSSSWRKNLAGAIRLLNDSLSEGTDTELANFFRSDDYDNSDPETVIGKFSGIIAAQIVDVTETVIDLT